MKVIIPTRGLIYSRTLTSLIKSNINLNKDLIIVEGLPIPDSHNKGVEIALQDYDPYILFIEEDMVLPEGALDKMIKMDKPVVCIDYPVGNGYSTIAKKNGEILWCGLGCTLIRRNIFDAIEKPWFDISYSWRIVSDNPFKIEKVENLNKYGGHDINFFIKVRKAGYKIYQLPGFEAEHLECLALKKGDYNQGVFEIKAKDKISKLQNYT